MKVSATTLEIAGLGLILIGGLMITGIFQPFSGSSTTTCIGYLVWVFCIGYWQNNTVVNGNNLIVGIALAFGGAIAFFIGWDMTKHDS